MVKELIFRADFFREDGVYVGICPELNVSSFGEDMDDARRSLREDVIAFIEECDEMGTLEEILEEAGFTGKVVIKTSPGRVPVIHIRTNMTTAGMSRDRYFELLDMAK